MFVTSGIGQTQGQHCSKIMKPPQSLPLQMAERLLRAQPDSVANHVTARLISDWRALTWLATESGWARSKRSAICSGKPISAYMITTTWIGGTVSRIYISSLWGQTFVVTSSAITEMTAQCCTNRIFAVECVVPLWNELFLSNFWEYRYKSYIAES